MATEGGRHGVIKQTKGQNTVFSMGKVMEVVTGHKNDCTPAFLELQETYSRAQRPIP